METSSGRPARVNHEPDRSDVDRHQDPAAVLDRDQRAIASFDGQIE
jgi:hypothetical protein